MIYKGMCVGGIADGTQRQADKETMWVEARKKLPDGSFVPTGKRTDYVYLELLGNKVESIGVWVPKDIAQANDVSLVVKRLIACYQPFKGAPIIRGESSEIH